MEDIIAVAVRFQAHVRLALFMAMHRGCRGEAAFVETMVQLLVEQAAGAEKSIQLGQ
jgi:hypothetical protein